MTLFILSSPSYRQRWNSILFPARFCVSFSSKTQGGIVSAERLNEGYRRERGTKCKITSVNTIWFFRLSFLFIRSKRARSLVPRALIPFCVHSASRRSKMLLALFEGSKRHRLKGKLSLFAIIPSSPFRPGTSAYFSSRNYSRISVMEQRCWRGSRKQDSVLEDHRRRVIVYLVCRRIVKTRGAPRRTLRCKRVSLEAFCQISEEKSHERGRATVSKSRHHARGNGEFRLVARFP